MKTITNKLKTIAKTLLLIVAIILAFICAMFIMYVFVPLSSDAEPRNVPAVYSHFYVTLPVQSKVIDHELFHPMGEFGYYAIVRIRSQEISSFLAQPGFLIYLPSQEAREKKLILQNWQNTGEFWTTWTIR